MCGIAGFLAADRDAGDPHELLQAMNRALAHRGPDGEGTFSKPGIGLAHRRLAVIDVECGQQPIVSADGQTAIVLNGEIYNYRELREELTREGRRFRTQSDTEVVLQLFELTDYLLHLLSVHDQRHPSQIGPLRRRNGDRLDLERPSTE